MQLDQETETISEKLSEMALAAKDFCDLIREHEQSRDAWLEDLYALLPRLHSAVTALKSHNVNDLPVPEIDLDERADQGEAMAIRLPLPRLDRRQRRRLPGYRALLTTGR